MRILLFSLKQVSFNTEGPGSLQLLREVHTVTHRDPTTETV